MGRAISGGKLFESWGVQGDSREFSLCGSLASPSELVWFDPCLETNWGAGSGEQRLGLDCDQTWSCLSEREEALEEEGVYWSGPDQQEKDSIPRRLVARCCVEAMNTPASIGKILEVTSSASRPLISLPDALLSIDS